MAACSRHVLLHFVVPKYDGEQKGQPDMEGPRFLRLVGGKPWNIIIIEARGGGSCCQIGL